MKIVFLLAIADQCPLQGGFAVYEARSLYRRFVPSATWSPHFGCGYLRPGEREGDYMRGRSFNFLVSPNPADYALWITSLSTLETEARVELYDLLGQQVYAASIPAGQTAVAVLVSHLPTGVYVYRISQAGKLVQTDKLIVSH